MVGCMHDALDSIRSISKVAIAFPNMLLSEIGIGCRIVFGFFVGQVLDFWGFSFLALFALYLQQFGTRTWHFAWYLLHFGMVILHFAWYLQHFGTSTSHLHGI